MTFIGKEHRGAGPSSTTSPTPARKAGEFAYLVVPEKKGPHAAVIGCGEPCSLGVDTSAGAEQSYFEDCPVCCKPMEVFVRCEPGQILSISVSAD